MPGEGRLSVVPAQAATHPGRRLGERVVTAAVLAPLVLVAAVHLSTAWVGAIAAVIVLLAAREWARLSGITGAAGQAAYVAAVAALLAALALAGPEALLLATAGAAAGWVVALGWLVWLERAGAVPRWPAAPVRAAIGPLVLAGGWAGVVTVHAGGLDGASLLLLLLAVWCADTAAYFGGRRWGRRRLAPRVSPGKTVAGAVAGLAAGTAVALPWGALTGLEPRRLGAVVLAIMAALVFSVVGDLVESVLKRAAGAKDSGHLLPGHGGMLDRIDSLLAAAPVLAVATRGLGLAS